MVELDSVKSLRLVAATMTLAAGCVAVGHAADRAQDARSAYRFNARGADAFRLARSGSTAAAQPAVAPQLSGKPYAEQIERAAREASLDPALVHAVIHVESRYNAAARSPKGALGLMQVLPETAERYGVANVSRSVGANLSVGTRYLRDLMNLFGDRVELALAAYNAGENAVVRYGERVPPYAETRAYVPAVLEKYREWRGPLPATAPPRIQYLPGTTLEPDAKSRHGVN